MRIAERCLLTLIRANQSSVSGCERLAPKRAGQGPEYMDMFVSPRLLPCPHIFNLPSLM